MIDLKFRRDPKSGAYDIVLGNDTLGVLERECGDNGWVVAMLDGCIESCDTLREAKRTADHLVASMITEHISTAKREAIDKRAHQLHSALLVVRNDPNFDVLMRPTESRVKHVLQCCKL